MQRFTSNRMEILAANLAAHLMEDPCDPMEPEIILVQSRGMERWLSMELARWSGVCANVSFLYPGSLMEQCLLPLVETGDPKAWEKASLRWSLYHILQNLPEDAAFLPLEQYTLKDPLRILQLANLLAELFDEYLLFRPERILLWEKGRDGDFQGKLWRLLRDSLSAPHKLDLLKAFYAGKIGESSLSLSKRISIFGVSALPPLYLSFLEKLGEAALVRWYLLDPCETYWGDISIKKTDLFSGSFEEEIAAPQEMEEEKSHPILASLGKTGRDFFGSLASMGGDEKRFFLDPGDDSLLHRIQSGIGSLDPDYLSFLSGIPLEESDDSIRVHACHGPMREMEVLRDELLRLFSGEISPSSREILVMFPDIGTYAPYIEAVFGQLLPDGGRLSYRIADRNLLSENRVASLLVKIIGLLSSRFTATEVFDILEYPVVAGSFHLSDADLEEIRFWIEDIRISWGLDGSFKKIEGLPAAEGGTWKAALDRMVLGVATEDTGIFQDSFLPYDPMGPEKAPVLEGFLNFMGKLVLLYEESKTPRSMQDWATLLNDFLTDFFDGNPVLEGEMILVRQTLGSLCKEAGRSGIEEIFPFAVFRASFMDAFSTGKSLAAFPGGGITFCAMVPMRCIPYATICLCGMNEGDFPRKQPRPAFDLMAREPRRGDRSRRDDDRYLFLETLLSARDRFWLFYTGFKQEDNSMLPPSVLVEELLHSAGDGREKLLFTHPMQPFSPGLFMGDGSKSFSRENLAIAKAILAPSKEESFIFQDMVPESEEAEKKEIFLTDLISFFMDPANFFLKQAPGIHVKRETKALSDEELFSLDGLDKYSLRQRFCENILEEKDGSLLWKRLELENRLPSGARGRILVRELDEEGKALAGTIKGTHAPIAPQGKFVRLDLGDFVLEGKVPESGEGKEVLWRGGQIRSKDLLCVWIHFIFRKALGLNTVLYFVGAEKKKGKGPDDLVVFAGEPDAKALLLDLVGIFQEGRKRATPFFPEFSREFVKRRYFSEKKNLTEEEALEKAQEDLEKAGKDRATALLWQGRDPFAPPFAELAEKIWMPILDLLGNPVSD